MQTMCKDYFKNLALSQSDVKNLLNSYQMFKLKRESNESTPAMEFGTAFHTAILEPEKFVNEYAVFNGDKRTKTGKEEYELLSASKRVINANEYKLLTDMQEAFNASEFAQILKESKIEQELYFNYDGHDCKAKIDFYRENPSIEYDAEIYDIKTIDNCTEKNIFYTIKDRMYYLQDFYYRLALARNFMFDSKFTFIFISKSYPITIQPVRIDFDTDYVKSIIKKAFNEYDKYKDLEPPKFVINNELNFNL